MILDEFPGTVHQRPHEGGVAMVSHLPMRIPLPFDERAEGLAFRAGRRLGAGVVGDRPIDLIVVEWRVPTLAGGNARASQNERDFERVLVEILFTKQAIASAGEAVVGGKDDD